MRLSLMILLSLLLVHCTQEPETEHISTLDEIPEHILEVENLTVFPGDAEPVYDVELIPEVTFDDAKGPYLNRVLSAVVDDREQVFILGANTSY